MEFLDLNTDKKIDNKKHMFSLPINSFTALSDFEFFVNDLYKNGMLQFRPRRIFQDAIDGVESYVVDFMCIHADNKEQNVWADIEFKEELFEERGFRLQLEHILNKSLDVLYEYFVFNSQYRPNFYVFSKNGLINIDFCAGSSAGFGCAPDYTLKFSVEEFKKSNYTILGDLLLELFTNLYDSGIINWVPNEINSKIKEYASSDSKKISISFAFVSPYSEKLIKE